MKGILSASLHVIAPTSTMRIPSARKSYDGETIKGQHLNMYEWEAEHKYTYSVSYICQVKRSLHCGSKISTVPNVLQ